jgi:hypothetical protein
MRWCSDIARLQDELVNPMLYFREDYPSTVDQNKRVLTIKAFGVYGNAALMGSMTGSGPQSLGAETRNS